MTSSQRATYLGGGALVAKNRISAAVRDGIDGRVGLPPGARNTTQQRAQSISHCAVNSRATLAAGSRAARRSSVYTTDETDEKELGGDAGSGAHGPTGALGVCGLVGVWMWTACATSRARAHSKRRATRGAHQLSAAVWSMPHCRVE